MEIAVFARACEKFWNAYLSSIQTALEQGRISTQVDSPVPSFPQSLLITELPDHFAMELIGGRRRHKPLKVLRHALSDANLYFGQFDKPSGTIAMFDMSGSHHMGISRLALVTPRSRVELDRRFPGVSALHATSLQWGGEPDPLPLRLSIESDFLRLDECLLVNSQASAVRIRHVQLCVLVQKTTTERALLDYLQSEFPLSGELTGFRMLPGQEAEVTQLAAQFANIYLLNGLREVSIGQFIEQHEAVLTRALGAERLVSEPYVQWQTPSPDPKETAINPDLFLVRSDATCDVFDLKLPLHNRRKITRGERRRRRFIDSVDEGIAQLAHYRDFLSEPANRRHAEAKYGVNLQSPRFGLVVGNYENAHTAEIEEASRQLNDFTLIDYDTLLQLYVAASRIDPIGKQVTIE